MNQLSPAERHEFQKSMEIEWQTLLQNQAAEVLSQDSLSRVLQTLTSKTQSHSPTLTREGIMTVLQSVCSHGHKLQYGDVQQAFITGDPIKRKQPLFVRMPPDGVPGGLVVSGCSRQKQSMMPSASPLTVYYNGGTVSLLQPEVWGSRHSSWNRVFWPQGTQQKYHGIVGVVVDDIAGGGNEVWEQAISKLKQRFTFGHWEVGKGKFCSREVVQAADGSMRVGQPAYMKSLDFVPLGKLRKEHSGDANMNEKTAIRSVLGALGYLARESRPDLSGPVSILQSRFNKAQVSDIPETNRVVRLAKTHTDLALPVCKIPLDQICFAS